MRSALRVLWVVALWALPAVAQTDSLATQRADSVAQDSASDLVARVEILEKARRAAMVAGDTNMLANILAEDATYTHSTGLTQTRTQLLRGLETGKFRYLTFMVDDVKYRAYDHTVVGTGVQRIDVQAEGKTLTVRSRYTVVYVLKGDALEMVAYQSTSSPGIAPPKSR